MMWGKLKAALLASIVGIAGVIEASANGGSGGGGGTSAQLPTYIVSAAALTAYATPTDIFCISGSATKTVRLVTFSFYIQSTAAASGTWIWVKRSTADTGGSPTNPTAIPLDSADPAATAVVNLYTAAPSALGTSLGNLFVQVFNTTTLALSSISLNSAAVVNGIAYPSTPGYSKPLTLHGANESLCLNFNGAALPGGFTSQYVFSWTEN